MKTHTGETGWSCSSCNKILTSRAMRDLHLKSCGQEKGHWCRECNRGYTTKQALVVHLKAKHGPAPSVEELTCPTCAKIFKIVKTMREHFATHKGPFYCQVEGCQAGPFSLPKRLNQHLEENTDLPPGRSELSLSLFAIYKRLSHLLFIYMYFLMVICSRHFVLINGLIDDMSSTA